MCNDKALLEEAIQLAPVNYCQNLDQNKIKNFVILLCNSICVRTKDIEKGFKILNSSNKIDTVTTVSKFNNFSPVRAKKIKGKKLLNYIPNKELKDLHRYRVIGIKVYILIIVRNHLQYLEQKLLKYEKKNPFPFNWMSKNTSFIFQDSCVGDIDFPWQIEATKWWLKKYLKRN